MGLWACRCPFAYFTPRICICDQLWVISHAHVRKLVKAHTEVKDHLEKVNGVRVKVRV